MAPHTICGICLTVVLSHSATDKSHLAVVYSSCPFCKISVFENKLLPSYFVPLFQNKSGQTFKHENKLNLHENEQVGRTHFYVNRFT